MGTRHLIAVQIDGQYKVAQYGQWDGYPSYQGVAVLEFLRRTTKSSFANSVRACSEITEEEYKSAWAECGADPLSEFVDLNVLNKFRDTYPHLDRSYSCDILYLIERSGGGRIKIAKSNRICCRIAIL